MTLEQGIDGQGAMIMLRHEVSQTPRYSDEEGPLVTTLVVSAANPHSVGGVLVFRVTGRYTGEGCVANGDNSTTVTLSVPTDGRVNGQGVSGLTVSTRCHSESLSK